MRAQVSARQTVQSSARPLNYVHPQRKPRLKSVRFGLLKNPSTGLRGLLVGIAISMMLWVAFAALWLALS
jgi:hypothetical protein